MGSFQDGMGVALNVLAPRRQVGVAVVVVSLHLLGLLAWWSARHEAPASGKSSQPASITVLLTPLVNDDEVHKKKPPTERSGRRADSHMTRSAAPISLALPSTDTALSAPGPSATAEPPTAAASDLNLILSRKALSSLAAPGLAARTPFQGRLPATVERQIAGAAAETGPWTEERLDIDHIRYRRGSTCITMSRPKAAMIDPFSDSIRRLPWFAEIYTCS